MAQHFRMRHRISQVNGLIDSDEDSDKENSEDKDLTMLDIRGLTLDEATIELTLVGLNIGTVTYDESVSNKAQAVIYKQIPQSGSEVYMGKEIDIFLKEAD